MYQVPELVRVRAGWKGREGAAPFWPAWILAGVLAWGITQPLTKLLSVRTRAISADLPGNW